MHGFFGQINKLDVTRRLSAVAAGISPAMRGFYSRMKKRHGTRRLTIVVVAAALASVVLLYLLADWGGTPADGAYRLAKSDRGELLATVSATGPINPVATVIVGSQ